MSTQWESLHVNAQIGIARQTYWSQLLKKFDEARWGCAAAGGVVGTLVGIISLRVKTVHERQMNRAIIKGCTDGVQANSGLAPWCRSDRSGV
jgi:hypothetical protein